MPDLVGKLSRHLLTEHPLEAARVIEGLSAPDGAAFLAAVPPAQAAGAFAGMIPGAAAALLAHLDPAAAGAQLAAIPLARVAAILRATPPAQREPLLSAMPEAPARRLRRILAYPENSAGALMDPSGITLPDDITAREALRRVLHAATHARYYLYVINRDQSLVGVLTLRELMVARGTAPVSTLMRSPVHALTAGADRADIVHDPNWRTFHTLPVVDECHTFLGVMPYETLRTLEHGLEGRPATQTMLATVLALGELYWIALAATLLRGMPPASRAPQPQEHVHDA
jgi:magnesium transporter